MIARFSHLCVYVLDQEEALTFYRDKLGFEVRMDVTMDNGFRWLTVGPKAQPELSLILCAIREGFAMDAAKAASLRSLVQSGCLGVAVMEVDDCRATYEELRARGVKFKSEPAERPYGIEAVMVDNSGNWFSMVQRRK